MKVNGLNYIQEQNEYEDDQSFSNSVSKRDARSKQQQKDLNQFNQSVSITAYSNAQANVDASRKRKSQIKAILEDRVAETVKSVNRSKKNPNPNI